MNENPPESLPRKGLRAKLVPAILLVVLLLIGVMLLLPSIDATRNRPPNPCRSAIKAIGIAMHRYYSQYGCLPPAYVADKDGRPVHSWRVLILPFLEGEALYDRYRFDEPWDSPHNLALARDVPKGMNPNYPMYHCPSDRDSNIWDTSYVMVVGPRTISDGPTSTDLMKMPDGSSNTILVAEMSDSGVHWMEPQDLKFDEMSFKVDDPDKRGIRSRHRGYVNGYVNVVFCDVAIGTIHEDIDPGLLKGLLTRNGGEDVSEFFNPTDRRH